MPGVRRGVASSRGRADPRAAAPVDAEPSARAKAPRAEAAAESPGERARELCLRLLAARPYTRAELAAALRRHGVADDVAAEVLDRYNEVGMIDDRAFALAWVTSRHHGRGMARRALAGELRRKGVETEAVAAGLEGVDDDTEAATARALVDRKLRAASGRDDPGVLVRRLVGMLARKGYPPGLAYRTVRAALADVASTASAGEVESAADYVESISIDEDGSGDDEFGHPV